jgi:hypothetical protein
VATKSKSTRASKPASKYAQVVYLPKPVSRVPKDGDVIMTKDGKRAVRGGMLAYPKRGESTGVAAPKTKQAVIARCQNGWAPAGARSEAELAVARERREARKAKAQASTPDVEAIVAKAVAEVLKALA